MFWHREKNIANIAEIETLVDELKKQIAIKQKVEEKILASGPAAIKPLIKARGNHADFCPTCVTIENLLNDLGLEHRDTYAERDYYKGDADQYYCFKCGAELEKNNKGKADWLKCPACKDEFELTGEESYEDYFGDDEEDGEEEEAAEFIFNKKEYVKKHGRNDPCPCGSGKKYKKCCLGKEQ